MPKQHRNTSPPSRRHAMPSLLQAATAVVQQADPLGGHLIQAAVVLIFALQAWVVRVVTATRDDIRTIRQTLFGVNNDNGINGTVTDHEHRIAECEAYIERTVPERLRFWEAWKDQISKKVDEAWAAVHKARNSANEAVLNHTPRIEQLERESADRRAGPNDRRHE